jgi:hypothetical protein
MKVDDERYFELDTNRYSKVNTNRYFKVEPIFTPASGQPVPKLKH